MEEKWTGWLVAGGTALVGIGTWLIQFLNNRRENKSKDRREALEEAYVLLDKKTKDVEREEARSEELLKILRTCERTSDRMREWIAYAMYVSTNANPPLKLRPFKEEGTDIHEALSTNFAIDRRVAKDPNFKGLDRRQPDEEKSHGE